jgi:hypothetical protein
MTPPRHPAYDGPVDVPRTRALRWIAAGLGLFVSLSITSAAPALAGTSSLDVGDQTVVNVLVRGRGNQVTVRVWDRSSVQVDYADESAPVMEKQSIPFGTPRFPLSQQIPLQLFVARDKDGQIVPSAPLPPEVFPYASFRPGPHDAVSVVAPEGARLVLTVPASTGILSLRIGGGQTVLEGYRGANLFIVQNQGRVQLTGATTTAFVQMNYGVFYAADGNFERFRIRGIGAHDVFEHCRTKQIEATSVTGSILYDGGSFDPGLARFESLSGHIALGVNSAAQLVGRSQEGHVYTAFDRRATVDQRSEGEATATVGEGGPLVNAISTRGNVYFYEGTLAGRRSVAQEWRALHQLFNAHRRPSNAPPPAVRPPHPRI